MNKAKAEVNVGRWMQQRSFYAAVFLVTVLWSGLFAVMGVDLHHDGIMIVTAADVAAGKALFRESFAQYGILTPLLQGAALKIFGVELIVLRLLTALFYGGAAVMLDVVWKRFLSWPFRLLMLGMFWLLPPYLIATFHPWSSVYSLFSMLLAAEFALRAVEEKERTRSGRWWFACGATAAVTFGFRQPCGMVTLLAGMAALLLGWYSGRLTRRETGHHLAALAGGAVVILALFALYLTLFDCWKDYLLQNFNFIFRFAWQRGGSGDYGRLSNAFFPIVTDDDLSPFIFGVLPLITIALFWWYSRQALRDRTALQPHLALLTLLLFALASWHQYYPVPCIRHLYWGGVPMFGAYALLFEKTLQLKKPGKKWFLAGLLLLLLAPVVYLRIAGVRLRLPGISAPRTTLDVPTLHGMRLATGEAAMLGRLMEIREALPPELRARGILNCTEDAGYTLLLPETGFRHPMRQDWGDSVYRDYTARRDAYVRAHHPLLLRQHSPKEPVKPFGPDYQVVAAHHYHGSFFTLEAPKELR